MKQTCLALLAVLLVWCAAEATLQIHFRIRHGEWFASYNHHFDLPHRLFKWHPYLAVAGRPHGQVQTDHVYTHDELGFRNAFSLQKPGARIRIVTLGGSTTYGNGVSDPDTWPAQLGHELGDSYEVYNMSIPGYSTVENIIQMALLVPDLSPRVAVFYEGWNDVHTMHVRDLKPDYSDFHGPAVAAANDVFGQAGDLQQKLVTASLLWSLALQIGGALRDVAPQRQPGPGALTPSIDTRALALYQRNLKTLIGLARAQKVIPVMVPQVLNEARLRGTKPSLWAPYIRDQDLPGAQKVYNDAMRAVCQTEHASFVESVLHYPWQPTDFADEGHFSAAGGGRFAHLVGAEVHKMAISR